MYVRLHIAYFEPTIMVLSTVKNCVGVGAIEFGCKTIVLESRALATTQGRFNLRSFNEGL